MPTLFTKANVNKVLGQHYPKLRLKKLKNGDNIVRTEEDGTKLVATVVKGVIVNWGGYDADGNEIPTVVTTKPQKKKSSTGKKPISNPKWYLVCMCLNSGAVCWWVQCFNGRCASMT
ncbi:MAG: hypothetical protein WA738_22225 [Candidatus Angelobacter sp.]